MHFVVIARDAEDEGALERRLQNRDAHVKLSDTYKESGNLLMATALLNNEGEMCGSVMTFNFENRAELDAWFKEEPYVMGEVWGDVEIIPAKVGPSFQGKS